MAKSTKAAAAAAQFAPASSDVPEFQVISAPEWEEDSSAADQQPDDDDSV